MKTEPSGSGCSCAPAAAGPRRASWLGLSLGVLGVALAPKCPLCLAAWLALWSLSGALAGVLDLMRPAGLALASLSLGYLVLSWLRARRIRFF